MDVKSLHEQEIESLWQAIDKIAVNFPAIANLYAHFKNGEFQGGEQEFLLRCVIALAHENMVMQEACESLV